MILKRAGQKILNINLIIKMFELIALVVKACVYYIAIFGTLVALLNCLLMNNK